MLFAMKKRHNCWTFSSYFLTSLNNSYVTFLLSSLLLLCSYVPGCHAVWAAAQGAGVRGLPHRAALPRKWCCNGWDGQLWTHWWQDLWCRPLPNGEHTVLPPWCTKDYVPEVCMCPVRHFAKCTLLLYWLNCAAKNILTSLVSFLNMCKCFGSR